MQNAYGMRATKPPFPDFRIDIDLRLRGRSRRLAIGRNTTFAAFAALVALTAWALAAGFYVCFHDELLASLMARQTDMQYAYEDQIAALRTEVGRDASRNLIDQHTIDTALRDLTSRAARLEAHATAIDKAVGDSTQNLAALPGKRSGSTIAVPGGPSRPAMDEGELDTSGNASTGFRHGKGGDRADASPDSLFRQFSAIETTQVATVGRLRGPLLRETRRLAAALAQVGLAHERMQSVGAGGPFVPLSAEAQGDFDIQITLLHDAIEQRARLSALVDRVPLRKPLSGALEISSPFGARLDPFLARPAMHTGVDLLQTEGDTVYATAAGTVTAAGPNGGYGDMVEIDHGGGFATRYAHLSMIGVMLHQRVEPGTPIGRVGATGRATGRHLHYETRINGEPVDPTRFLSAGLRLGGD